MKRIVTIVCLLFTVMLTSKVDAQNIAINEDGSSPDGSSILDLKSSNKGLLMPRLTTTEMNAISSPAKGLMVYNSQTNLVMVNIGTSSSPLWTAVGGASGGAPSYTFNTGTSGTDFNIATSGTDNTFNLPDASATARGVVTTGAQTLGGKKTFADSIIAGSGVRLTSLASGASTDSILTISSTGVIKKRTATDFVNDQPVSISFAEAVNFEDFVFDEYSGATGPSTGGKNDNQYSFSPATNGGAGATSNVDGTSALFTSYGAGNDYVGIHRLNTGTTSTGKAGLGSSDFANRIKIGGPYQILFEIRVRFSAQPSASGQTYVSYLGLSDLAAGTTTTLSSGTTIANGVYFLFNSSGLQGVCRSGGTAAGNATSTSTVALSSNTWYKLKAIISAGGSSVDFYVDGTKIGSSLTTNIPTSNPMKYVFLMEKTSGTTTVYSDIDYLGWKMVR